MGRFVFLHGRPRSGLRLCYGRGGWRQRRRAHQTWRKKWGGRAELALRSRRVSAPTWWQGKPFSMRRGEASEVVISWIQVSGLRVLRAGKRLKSRSTLHSSVTPWMRQQAAMWASWTRAPLTRVVVTSSAK